MDASPALNRYLRGFSNSLEEWPAEAPRDPRLAWWHTLPWKADRETAWARITGAMPQLRLPQQSEISQSDLYRQLVLRGVAPPAASLIPISSILKQPEELQLQLVGYPYVAMPVLSTSNREDFLWLVRALAHRAEPVTIEAGVHAQAISGLINWELIRSLGPDQRASLILLHEAPYGSVAAEDLPIHLDQHGWIQASSTLRLEHELTHLTTKKVLGEMRLNLLDELIADAMGQLMALRQFSAMVFDRCLERRWRAYVGELNEEEAEWALGLARARAHELELALSPWQGTTPVHKQLLPWLCRLRLDQAIDQAAPHPVAKAD